MLKELNVRYINGIKLQPHCKIMQPHFLALIQEFPRNGDLCVDNRGSRFYRFSHRHQTFADKKVDKVVLLDNLSSFVNTTNSSYVDYRKYRLKGYESDIILERGDTKYLKRSIREILEKYQPKLVFHMAALPLVKIQNLNSEEAKSGSVDSTFLIEKLGQMKMKSRFNTERFVYRHPVWFMEISRVSTLQRTQIPNP